MGKAGQAKLQRRLRRLTNHPNRLARVRKFLNVTIIMHPHLRHPLAVGDRTKRVYVVRDHGVRVLPRLYRLEQGARPSDRNR